MIRRPARPDRPRVTPRPNIARASGLLLFFVMLFVTWLAPSLAHAVCPPAFVQQWGGQGSGPGQIGGNYGITTDELGQVYVADLTNDRISVYLPEGTFLRSWGTHGTGPGQFNGVVTMSVRNGFVYTIDDDRVQKFTTSGSWVMQFGTGGLGAGQLRDPRGIVVAPDGTIYVADSGNERVQYFTPTGVFQGSWFVNQPYDIDISPFGQLVVLGHDGWVYRYSPTGSLSAAWDGGTFGLMIDPKGLDVDASGRVYVADSVNERMLLFSDSGQPLIQWQHDFNAPRDVVRGSGNDIFVSDTFNRLVKRFAADDAGDCAPPPPPNPGGSQLGTAVLLHVREVPPALSCAAGPPGDCVSAITSGSLSTPAGPFHFVYLLAKIDTLLNIAGVQCGISYQSGQPGNIADGIGLDIYGWHNCASLAFPTGAPAWPAPGSGILLTWEPVNRCQVGQFAVAGYFYVGAYSADVLRVTPHPLDGQAKLATCASREGIVSPSRLGFAAFSNSGLVPGCNPCVEAACDKPTAVTPSTWSGIKAVLSPTLKPGTKRGSH